jgi:hypothetical protein
MTVPTQNAEYNGWVQLFSLPFLESGPFVGEGMP